MYVKLKFFILECAVVAYIGTLLALPLSEDEGTLCREKKCKSWGYFDYCRDELFVDTLECGVQHVMHRRNEVRNPRTGEVVFYWEFGIFRLHFWIDKAILRATQILCRGLKAAVRRQVAALVQLQESVGTLGPTLAVLTNATNSTQQFRLAIRMATTRARRELDVSDEELRPFAIADGDILSRVPRPAVPVYISQVPFRVMTARLIHIYSVWLMHSSRDPTIQGLRMVDRLLKDLLWSLYYNQIISGFFVCLPYYNAYMEGKETMPDMTCHADQTRFQYVEHPHVNYFFQSGGDCRHEHIEQLLQSHGSTARLLEIGVRHGDVPDFVLERQEGVTYMGVDPYVADDNYGGDLDYQQAKTKLERFGVRATLFLGVLEDIARSSVDRFHVAFVDADHRFLPAHQDAKLAEDLLVPGGIVSGHDFTPWYYGVMLAVFVSAMRHPSFRVTLAADSVWWYDIG